MARRELVVGECAKVSRIIVNVTPVQNGKTVVEFIHPLYVPEMAVYQGMTGYVTSLDEAKGLATVKFPNIGKGEDWDFRIIDLEYESPYIQERQTIDMVDRGFITLK